MFEQLSQHWHLIPDEDTDTVDAAPARSRSGCDTVHSAYTVCSVAAVRARRPLSGRDAVDVENDDTHGSSKRQRKDGGKVVDKTQWSVMSWISTQFRRMLGLAPESTAPRKSTNETDGPTPSAGALARLPCYNMGHKKRGKFIIINNEIFEPQTYVGRRAGTNVDARELNKVFTKIGFEVEAHKDLTVQQMKEQIKLVAKYDHSECDCLGVAVLSHGTTEDVLYGTNDVISLTELIEPLKNCPSLNGKPKLIIIQACRGEKLMRAVDVADDVTDDVTDDVGDGDDYIDAAEDVTDGPRKPQTVPREADFLYVHATPPGHFAWRNTSNGSWFIQALCKQMAVFAYELDLVTLLTLVNNQVAHDYESATRNPATNDMRQVSSVVSMLTKMLWLKPKK